jgi:plasmid stability protein
MVSLMSNVQVKNLEPEMHEQLRARAVEAGATISDYVLQLIRRDLQLPARRQWLNAISQLPRHEFARSEISDAIRAGREQR